MVAYSPDSPGQSGEMPRATDPDRDSDPRSVIPWRAIYVLLVGQLLVLIALFYALTRWAS